MNLYSSTISFCPTCYLEIPAKISIGRELVTMEKTCPVHGKSTGIVERDPLFYQHIRSLRSPSIYDGYFVDVTMVCNLRCSACFHPLAKTDPEGEYSIENILNECRVNRALGPFIITGGEPTVRPDIVELATKMKEIGPIELLSNGVKLAEEGLFTDMMALLKNEDSDVVNLNLSLHLKETDKWMVVVARCRSLGLKIESALIVIENKEEFLKAVELAKSLSDVIVSFRIKNASKLWNEQRPVEKVFVSDMLRWLEEQGKPLQMIPSRHNKISIINVVYDAVHLMLVSWYDVGNCDILDVDCAPYYRAKNGEVRNFVTACIINEGIAAGFVKGGKIESLTKAHK